MIVRAHDALSLQVGLVPAFVAQLCPTATLTYNVGGTFKFELPCESITLSAVFAAMASRRQVVAFEQQSEASVELPQQLPAEAQLENRVGKKTESENKRVSEGDASELVVLDWGISSATLEEVFVRLAKTNGAQQLEGEAGRREAGSERWRHMFPWLKQAKLTPTPQDMMVRSGSHSSSSSSSAIKQSDVNV
jgi:hypothetical protein